MGIEFVTAALLDLDGSFFVQLVIFLLLWGILTPLVFKPYLKVQEAKDDLTTGRKARAKKIEAKAEEIEQKYREDLKKTRAKGQEEWARLREEGQEAKDDILMQEQRALQVKLEKEMQAVKRQEKVMETKKAVMAQELASMINKKVMEVER